MRDWYGWVPAHWRRARVKFVAERVTDGAHISPDTEGGVYDFVSTRDVKGGTINYAGSLKTSPETYEYMLKSGCRPNRGDVLFSKDGTVGETAIVKEEHDFAVASSLVIITPRSGVITPSYLAYVFASRPAREQAASFMRGAGLPRLSVGNLGRVELPVPPMEEQRAITLYLDRETALIDTLIEEQQRLIDMTQQRLRAVGTAEVGWRVGSGMRLKWFFSERDDRAGAEADVLPLMSVSISWGVRRRDEVTQDDRRAEDLSNYKLCKKGDLVVNRMRAFQGALGLAHEDGVVSPDYAVLRASPEVSVEWLVAVMKTEAFVRQMAQRVKGIGSTDLGSARTPRINVADLAEIRIEFPPVGQQVAEFRRLKEQTAKGDTLVRETERFIELAQERRSALITAAVTGQIAVGAGA